MRKILYSIALIPFWLNFILIMILFHPILWIASKCGTKILDSTIRLLNHIHIANLFITTGSRCLKNIIHIPDQTKPIIIVSNHQNMYDVALLITAFSKTTPHFIAKKQLSKWIPSVSLILRTRNGVLIDRSAGRDAVQTISEIASKMGDEKLCVVIFPEGTRAKDGVLKAFKQSGLKALLNGNPAADVIPVSFSQNWKFGNPKAIPSPFCVTSKMTIHPAINRSSTIIEQVQLIEKTITQDLI